MRKTNRRTAPKAIADRANFSNSGGTLRGEHFPAGIEGRFLSSFGRLDSDERARITSEILTYVVWSYATPIAYETENGSTYVVEQKFSPTTSKHQHLVRMGFLEPAWAEAMANRG